MFLLSVGSDNIEKIACTLEEVAKELREFKEDNGVSLTYIPYEYEIYKDNNWSLFCNFLNLTANARQIKMKDHSTQ